MTQATKKLREVQDLLDHEIMRVVDSTKNLSEAHKELEAVFTALQAMQTEEHQLQRRTRALQGHGGSFAGLMEALRKILAVAHSMDGHLREKAVPRIGDELIRHEPIIREALANWDKALKVDTDG